MSLVSQATLFATLFSLLTRIAGPPRLKIVAPLASSQDVLAYVSCVLKVYFSALGLENIRIELTDVKDGATEADGMLVNGPHFACLDDALSHPGFATLHNVTLSLSCSKAAVTCELEQGPTLLPRTYARGLMSVQKCEGRFCGIHRGVRGALCSLTLSRLLRADRTNSSTKTLIVCSPSCRSRWLRPRPLLDTQ